MTESKKRLDEAAMNHAAKDWGTVGNPNPSTAPMLRSAADYKAGTRYGIEWVIEEMEKSGARGIIVAQGIREHFAPILKGGGE